MTNREFIIAQVQKEKNAMRLIDVFECLYECCPDKSPVRSACEFCEAIHDGKCPDECDGSMGDTCDDAVLKWLDAEVEYK